ncbi:MAG TPA: 3'(2'),5'-bisphosphate nucleotidase CysQ [Steroidobacteraceae bacterium]
MTSSPSAYTHLLGPVIEIAHRAGAEILDVYDTSNIAVADKADASPLTQADLRAHRSIVDGLSALTPEWPVLSEESATIDYSERSHWSRYWLVDPLDGTREFLSHNGEFTVNIALIDGHEPVLGVVYAPARQLLYYGIPGAGAFRAHADEPASAIVVKRHAASPLRIVGSRSHRGDSLDSLLSHLGSHELIAVGSSLKLCMVAEGSADLYPRLGATSEWDTAAAHAVVLAAGGYVTSTTGAPLTYNSRPELLNPHFLVYADRERQWHRFL